MSGGFFSRLKSGLSRSKEKIGQGLSNIFVRKKIDEESLEELEDLLIMADLGPEIAAQIVDSFRNKKFPAQVTSQEIQRALAHEIAPILDKVAIPFQPDEGHKPHIVLMVGVNGTGKTTTIGKMAYYFKEYGKKVLLVAGDTFRAAAVEQLQIWGERAQCPVIAGKAGDDAAGLAFDGVRQAQKERYDLVFVDTAGRLHNRQTLMDELAKIVRVMKKCDPTSPHSVLLVLDGTTGQNAIEQVRVFKEMVHVTGLVVTKLDGTAKGGIVVALAEQFGLPVYAVGVGEGIEDLQAFEAEDYACGLFGLNEFSPPSKKK